MKVFFEFVGGPRDTDFLEGCPEQSDVGNFDMDAATAYYWETRYGKLGSESFVLSPYATNRKVTHVVHASHVPEDKYEITDRVDVEGDVLIVAKYVGPVAHEELPSEHKCPWYERLVNLGIEEVTSVHENFPEMPFV